MDIPQTRIDPSGAATFHYGNKLLIIMRRPPNWKAPDDQLWSFSPETGVTVWGKTGDSQDQVNLRFLDEKAISKLEDGRAKVVWAGDTGRILASYSLDPENRRNSPPDLKPA